MKHNLEIFLLSSEFGCGRRGASLGPSAVMLEDFDRNGTFFKNNKVEIINSEIEKIENGDNSKWAKNIDNIIKYGNNALIKIEKSLDNGKFPVIFSGDHSNAIATISAFKNKYYNKNIGVIWIDAHADLHSPYTTPSGNIHGMALGALLGDVYCSSKKNEINNEDFIAWKKLIELGDKKIHPKIYPSDLVYIDIRELEEAEWTDIRDNNIKYFEPDEIREKTPELIAKETLKYLANCDLIYVSFDVDSLSPSISKGTGTSSEGGIMLEDAICMLKIFMESSKTAGIEFTEINPLADTENKMAKAVLKIIDAIF
ncbi:MAG: arginase [Bacteroidia bacterium]|nr:arginase [Bacteroidia bacterium]